MLVDLPVFRTPAEWGTVRVTGLYIEPDTVYEVRSDCRDPAEPENLSVGVAAQTYPWGDVTETHKTPPLQPDLDDIVCVLDGFIGGPSWPVACPGADLAGVASQCSPDGVIDLNDILGVLDAFGQAPYTCPAPCP